MKSYFLVTVFALFYSVTALCQDDQDSDYYEETVADTAAVYEDETDFESENREEQGYDADTTIDIKVHKGFGQYPLDASGKYIVLLKVEKRSHGRVLKGLMTKEHKILLKPEFYEIRMLGNCIVATSTTQTTTVYNTLFKSIYARQESPENFYNDNPLKQDISDNILRFSDRCVLIDDDGKHVQEFANIRELTMSNSSGLFLVNNGTKMYSSNSIMDSVAFYSLSDKKLRTKFVYSNVELLNTFLLKVFHLQKKKWQIVDSQLRVLYEGNTISVQQYLESGMQVAFGVNIDGNSAIIIDLKGNKVSKGSYSKIITYNAVHTSEFIVLKNNKYGIIDWREDIIRPFQYEQISVITQVLEHPEGNIEPIITQIVYLKKNGKYGLYDKKMRGGSVSLLEETIYDTIYNVKSRSLRNDDEEFIFQLKGKYGLLKNNIKLLNAEYDTIIRQPAYSNEVEVSYYIFKKGGKYGYLNWDGEYVKQQYDDIVGNYRVLLLKKNGSYLIHELSKKESLELKNINHVQNIKNSEYFTYKENGKYGLLAINYELSLSIKDTVLFDSIIHPENGYDEEFLVLLNGKWGAWRLRDHSIVIPIVYDAPPEFGFQLGCLVKKNNLYGIYSQYHQMEVIPCKYTGVVQLDYSSESHPGDNTFMCYTNGDSTYIKFMEGSVGHQIKGNFVIDTLENKNYTIVSKGKFEYIITDASSSKRDSVFYFSFIVDNRRVESDIYSSSLSAYNIYTQTARNYGMPTVMGIKDGNGKELVPPIYQKIIYRKKHYLAISSRGMIYENDNLFTIHLMNMKGVILRTYANLTNRLFAEQVFKNNPENLLAYSSDSLKNYIIREEDEYAPKSIVLKSLVIKRGKSEAYFVFNVKKNKIMSIPSYRYYKVISDDFFSGINEDKETIFNAEGKKLLEVEFVSFNQIRNGVLLIIDKNGKAYTLDVEGTKTPVTNYDYIYGFIDKEKNILVKKNDKYGILDKSLNVLVPVENDTIYYSSHENGEYNESDNLYDLLPVGHYLVRKGTKWGLFVMANNVLETKYDSISYTTNSQIWYSVMRDKKQNVFNVLSGKFVIDHFAEKVARLNYSVTEPGCMDEIYYDYTKILVKENSKVYIDGKLTSYQDFEIGQNNFRVNEEQDNYNDSHQPNYSDNRIVVFLKKDNKWGAVDLDNVVIVPIVYDTIMHINFVGVTSTVVNYYWSEYDYSQNLQNQYALVKNNNKIGLYLCSKGELVPCILPEQEDYYGISYEGTYFDGKLTSYLNFVNIKIRILFTDFFAQ